MDVSELRNAFLMTDNLGIQLKAFRDERLPAILANASDVVVDRDWSETIKEQESAERKSLLVTHIQPFDSVKPGYVLDVSKALSGESDNLRLCNEYAYDGYGCSSQRRLNFDGLLVQDGNNFLQLYRNGTTEEVDSTELMPPVSDSGKRWGTEVISARDLDISIFKSVGRRLALLKSLGLTSPVLVSLAVLGVKGCKLLVRRIIYMGDTPAHYDHKLSPYVIDRGSLVLSDLVIENLQELPLEGYRETSTGREYESWHAVEGLLRPYCDAIWNAVGYPRSEYFDPNGKWLGQVYRPDRP